MPDIFVLFCFNRNNNLIIWSYGPRMIFIEAELSDLNEHHLLSLVHFQIQKKTCTLAFPWARHLTLQSSSLQIWSHKIFVQLMDSLIHEKHIIVVFNTILVAQWRHESFELCENRRSNWLYHRRYQSRLQLKMPDFLPKKGTQHDITPIWEFFQNRQHDHSYTSIWSSGLLS